MNTSACRRATAEETRRNNCFSFLITPWCFPPAQPCNEKHTKGISVVQLYRLHQKVCVPHPLPLPLPPPPLILSPPLCAGRPSTLAVHVFTNVSEYLIVIIPLSSASGGLSVRTAELCLRCYCYCYFKKKKKTKTPKKKISRKKKKKKRCVMIYFVGFLFGRSAHFQIKEDKFQG